MINKKIALNKTSAIYYCNFMKFRLSKINLLKSFIDPRAYFSTFDNLGFI